MEKPSSHQEQEEEREQKQQELKLCLPLVKLRTHDNLNPFSILGFWVSKSLRNLSCRARFSNGDLWRRFLCSGYLLKSSVFCGSSVFLQEGEVGMESFVEKCEGMEFRKDGFDANGGESESFTDAIEDVSKISDVTEDEEKPQLNDRELEKQGSNISEIEMMKERFSKLLLGEDMSGCGRGVCTALAISNAITNLYATLFGQLWRLEPLAPEKKSMWRREMEWVLCVSDHIVELIPCWQTFPDGGKLEVMTCRPRSDLYINLPALRKLDTMLLDILDSFSNTEFWYVDQGILAPDADGSASFHRPLQRQEEKWWLPVPRLPPGGLLENSRKQLQHRRECTNQILKAAMAINSIALAEMEVPQPYLEALPKSGKISLGEVIYQYIMSDHFSPECLLDCLDLSSEHHALDIANRAEASINVWCQRTNSKPLTNTNHSTSKSSWEMVKELMMDADKRELLADRSKSLLVCLKERFPGLPQTTLDMCKIQYNKDVGKSIIESYSRVLESMAFNIVARIDDLLYVDDLSKHSDQFTSVPSVSVIAHKKLSIPYSVPILSTPCRTAFTIPSFSPASLVSPTRGERSPFLNSGKPRHRGFGVKKVLTNYLGLETKRKNCGNPNESDSIPNKIRDAPASATGTRDLVAAG